ncbi:MAG TPA: HAD family hydrolase [Vicinamibacterales bacterium]|jgi:D-glycero-D-manno-heptose 1,7-bisphosphate phosphatase
MPTSAVFLDRDGTLIEEVGYLDRVERVELYPWTIDAVRAFNRAGLRVVLVSNQSGVARGFFTEAVVDDVHRHLASLLAAGGARIDAYYYCPHHPDGKVARYALACECRKPQRGLVDRAVRELDVDPERSYVVGDRWLDVALARAVGAKGVLVRTGYGATEEMRPPEGLRADAIADNLVGAASWVLGDGDRNK